MVVETYIRDLTPKADDIHLAIMVVGAHYKSAVDERIRPYLGFLEPYAGLAIGWAGYKLGYRLHPYVSDFFAGVLLEEALTMWGGGGGGSPPPQPKTLTLEQLAEREATR